MSRVILGSALLSENEIRQIGDRGLKSISRRRVLMFSRSGHDPIFNRGGNTLRVRRCQQDALGHVRVERPARSNLHRAAIVDPGEWVRLSSIGGSSRSPHGPTSFELWAELESVGLAHDTRPERFAEARHVQIDEGVFD